MELDELTNSIISNQIVSDNNIQISILILRRGALSKVSLSLNVEEKAHSPYDNIAGV